MRAIALTVLLLLVSGVNYASEIPEGSTTIYRGYADVDNHDVVYFRAVDGTFTRWLIQKSNGKVKSEIRYTTLDGLRAALLAVDDHAGIMSSQEWYTDADGDGFSNMLEYLTNGDPYDESVCPTEPRILYFDGGQTFEALLPVRDAAGESGKTITTSNPALEEQAQVLILLISFFMGLFLWRLTILSMSRRNIL